MTGIPKCKWQTEYLATIRRDDSDIVVIAYVGIGTDDISYTAWIPCNGREYWTKREINGAIYGQIGTEWPHNEHNVRAAHDQIMWILGHGMCSVMRIDTDDFNPICYTPCYNGDELPVFVNVLTDIENIVRDCATIRAMESMVYAYEKVMA